MNCYSSLLTAHLKGDLEFRYLLSGRKIRRNARNELFYRGVNAGIFSVFQQLLSDPRFGEALHSSSPERRIRCVEIQGYQPNPNSKKSWTMTWFASEPLCIFMSNEPDHPIYDGGVGSIHIGEPPERFYI